MSNVRRHSSGRIVALILAALACADVAAYKGYFVIGLEQGETVLERRTLDENCQSALDTHKNVNGNVRKISGNGVDDVTNQYDALNRLIVFENAFNDQTTYQYDVLDNLVSVDPPAVGATTYGYNGFGDLEQETSPDRGTSIYENHDGLGNPGTMTDARNITVTYGYDALGRTTLLDYPNDTDTTYQYDSGCLNSNAYAAGRLCVITDESGSTMYGYDARGNVTDKQTVVTTGTGSATYDTGYEYDDADRLIQMTYPSGRIVDYERDDDTGRIIGVTTTMAGVTTTIIDGSQAQHGIEYAPFGPITEIKFGVSGHEYRSVYRLDADYRTREVEHFRPLGTSLDFRRYHHEPTGNVHRIEELSGSGSVMSSHDYVWDAASRLDEAHIGGVFSYDYLYDQNGNRTQSIFSSTFGAPRSTTYSTQFQSNRLLAAQQTAGYTGSHINPPRDYALDDAGSVTSIDVPSAWWWAYDLSIDYGDGNRPARMTTTDSAGQIVIDTAITHNGLGQRVGFDSTGPGAGTYPVEAHHAWLYDESGLLIADMDGGDVLFEYIYVDSRPVALFASWIPQVQGGAAPPYLALLLTDHFGQPSAGRAGRRFVGPRMLAARAIHARVLGLVLGRAPVGIPGPVLHARVGFVLQLLPGLRSKYGAVSPK